MSSPNVEILQRWLGAFNRGDLDAMVDTLDPDIELYEWPTAPGAQVYHGPDGALQAIDKWFEVWEWMRVEIENVVEIDDRLLVTFHQRAKGKGSEAEVEIKSFNVYTFSDSKITRVQLFTEREPALEAAGLTGSDIDRLQEVNEAVSSGDVRAIAQWFDEDIVWEHNIGGGSPEEGVYHGRDSVIALFERILEPWEAMRAQMRAVTEQEPGVYRVEGELHFKHLASSAEVTEPYVQRFEVRDGLLVKGEMAYGDLVREPGKRFAVGEETSR